MRKFKIPNYNWGLVKELSLRPEVRKPELWKRTNGPIGRFKDDVTRLLKAEQERRCAYCMAYLYEDRPARDHIAPRATYPAWTFKPENLVLTCYACNTDRKDVYDPIDVRHRKYKRCKFKIVHPYLDRPAAHFRYSVNDETCGILMTGITDKGQETIRLFELMTPERAKQRAADAIIQKAPNRLQLHFQNLYWSTVHSRAPLKPSTMIVPPRR